jgi:hypothetical protein
MSELCQIILFNILFTRRQEIMISLQLNSPILKKGEINYEAENTSSNTNKIDSLKMS